jgi:iron(III) transport system substrate-binding protein
MFAPRDPGFVQDVSGAAILKSSTHEAAAQRFLAFLTSPLGQRVLAHSDSFEYPLARGVAPNPALPPVSSFHPNAITPAQIGTGLAARDLLREAGLI